VQKPARDGVFDFTLGGELLGGKRLPPKRCNKEQFLGVKNEYASERGGWGWGKKKIQREKE